MKISQMINSNGNPAANQFIVSTEKGYYFQSYDTLIAFTDFSGTNIVFTDAWDYSSTTLKYLKIFLSTSLSKAELQKRIDKGIISVNNELQII